VERIIPATVPITRRKDDVPMTTEPDDDDAIYASPKLTDEEKQLWRNGRANRERLRKAAEGRWEIGAESNWVRMVASLHKGLPVLHTDTDEARLNQLVRSVTCERTGFPLAEWPNLNEAEREYWIGEALEWEPDEPEPLAEAELSPLIPSVEHEAAVTPVHESTGRPDQGNSKFDDAMYILTPMRQKVFRELWTAGKLTYKAVADLRGGRVVTPDAERVFVDRLIEVFDKKPQLGIRMFKETGGIRIEK
jgi:hypothetical protein